MECYINDVDMLVIDHIDGGGNKHRRELSKGGRGGTGFYRHLIDSGFPKGYQILCSNHNLKKEIERHRR